MRANEHIRAAIKKQRVTLWQTADKMGVSEMTLIRWLRFPLTEEKEAQIMEAIKTAAREG